MLRDAQNTPFPRASESPPRTVTPALGGTTTITTTATSTMTTKRPDLYAILGVPPTRRLDEITNRMNAAILLERSSHEHLFKIVRLFRLQPDDQALHFGRIGLEPPKSLVSTMERATGIEPAPSVWKTETLPLSSPPCAHDSTGPGC